MKFDKKTLSIFNSVINNVYFLYLIAFVSFIDIIGYIIRNEYSAVIFFYLIGMLTFYYTKNMSVVLLAALIGTTIMHFVNNLFGVKEGMKGSKKSKKNKQSKDEELEDELMEDEELEDELMEDEELGDDIDKLIDDEELQEEFTLSKDVLEKNKDEERKLNKFSGEMKKKSKEKNKQGYQNNMKLKPSLYNMPNKDQVAKQLGKADKMEKAYDNLEKIVGEKGIKSMNESTKSLIKQQDKLLKGLKDITPSINSAMESIGKIDFNKLGGMFGDDE